ncbi:hypothetical protein BGW38_008872 [Lunasporangiospora selenospora]|uniref:Galactosyl transferase GMA12/MNN10 family protein n=1 Tax=Lunasporangiospora selenospora TaxID=979761 RepID=A0A9P6K9C0_9FUNG|nr:hypothetical protein BGW38_008872 [Lunasporangiospora selenospora]
MLLRIRKRNITILTILVILISGLLAGPYIFVHFPRTCIPRVDDPSARANENTTITILSGELCNAPYSDSKCRIIGPLSYYNRREYTNHHQGRYTLRDEFTPHFESAIAKGYVPAWAKITILLEELERPDSEFPEGVRRPDWIFWIDTDVMIANMDIKLERFVDERYSLIITEDLNYLNAGVFLLKIDDWSRKFMRDIWSHAGNDFNEQDWIIKLIAAHSEYRDRVKYLPQCSFNSYWHTKKLYEMFRPGDFAVHWAGHNYDLASFRDWQVLRYFKFSK